MMFSLDAFRREMVAAICESQRILSGWQLRWRRSRPNDNRSIATIVKPWASAAGLDPALADPFKVMRVAGRKRIRNAEGLQPQ